MTLGELKGEQAVPLCVLAVAHSSPEKGNLVDQRLRAENDRQSEARGVFGLGFGGVNHDPEIVGGNDQRVARYTH